LTPIIRSLTKVQGHRMAPWEVGNMATSESSSPPIQNTIFIQKPLNNYEIICYFCYRYCGTRQGWKYAVFGRNCYWKLKSWQINWSIFSKIFDFFPKFSTFSKKVRFFPTFSIFFKILDFFQNFRFFPKFSIFSNFFDFLQKFRFLLKFTTKPWWFSTLG